jgi:hypothetical protein
LLAATTLVLLATTAASLLRPGRTEPVMQEALKSADSLLRQAT